MLVVLGRAFAVDSMVAAVVRARRDFVEKNLPIFVEEVFGRKNALDI